MTLQRDAGWAQLCAWTKSDALRKHARAVEEVMRAAALRYNREHARWLLTYLRRWMWCGFLFYGLGSVVEQLLNAPGLSLVFYVPGALSVRIAEGTPKTAFQFRVKVTDRVGGETVERIGQFRVE